MFRPSSWLPRAMALVAVATLSACPDPGPTLPENDIRTETPDQPDTPLTSLSSLTELSELGNARYADTAIDAQGTLHVVFTELPRGGKATVFYRASRDGGRSWTEVLNLSEVDRSHAAGVPRIAVDGRGRVYAAWKAMDESDTQDSLRGGAYGAPLVYRVLENGSWSDLGTIDSKGLVRSWFLAVAPDGQAHAVWVENGVAADGYKTISAARFAQASLTGSTVGAEREIFAPGPINPDDSGYLWRLPDYGGLRGYVDDQGSAHWSAYKVPAGESEDESVIVHWDGTRERELQSYVDYASFVGPYYNPPELLRDAQGREHVLLQDVKAARQSLLDLLPEAGTRSVLHATAPGSELRSFQVVRGPRGEAAALMTIKDRTAETPAYGLYVSRLQNGLWSAPVDVTRNAARILAQEGTRPGDGVNYYEPLYATGAFDAQGRLNLVMVADEVGINKLPFLTPKVFFLRL